MLKICTFWRLKIPYVPFRVFWRQMIAYFMSLFSLPQPCHTPRPITLSWANLADSSVAIQPGDLTNGLDAAELRGQLQS